MDLQHRDRRHADAPPMRASDLERDQALVRLHQAFAEGRLTSAELDQRMDAVLAARTRPEIDRLLADLPDGAPPPAPGKAEPVRAGGRWLVGFKSRVRRGGRWRLPRRYTVAVYKGGGVVDLSRAEFDEPVSVLRALAYKSDLHIVVPPGLRVEFGGLGVSGELDQEALPGAPLLRIQGLAYKGAVEVGTQHPEL
jgi:Domain of unknown function (DUF1707)